MNENENNIPNFEYIPPVQEPEQPAPAPVAEPAPDYVPPAQGYVPPVQGYVPPTPDYAPPTPDYAPQTPGYVPPTPGYVPPAPPAPPVYETPAAEAKPKKGKKGLLIGLIAAAAVIVLGVVAAFAIPAGNPVVSVKDGAEKSVNALMSSDVVTIMKNVAEKGSLTVDVDLDTITDGYLDGSATAKIYGGKDKTALEVSAKMDGSDVLGVAAYLDLNEGIAIKSNEILGKTVYGLDLKNAASNLKKSILNPDSGSDYAMDEDTFNELLDALDSVNSGEKTAKELAKHVEKVGNELITALGKSVNKHADVSRTSETLSMGDSEVKTKCISMELDGEAIAAVAGDVIKTLKSSKNVSELLKFIQNEPLFVEAIESEMRIDADELSEEFYEALDDAEENAADLAEELEDSSIKLDFYISSSGKQLVKMVVTIDDDGRKSSVSLSIGPDAKDPAFVELVYKVGNDRKTVTYTVKENSSKTYSAALKIKDNKDLIGSGKFNWNKSDGKWEFSLDVDGDEYSAEGKMSYAKGTLELVLDEFYDGYSYVEPGVKLTLKESDKAPSMPKYTDILTLKEGDIEDLIEELQENVMELVGELGLYRYLF